MHSVADVRRRHIEAYKQAVGGMRVGEHAAPAAHNSARDPSRGTALGLVPGALHLVRQGLLRHARGAGVPRAAGSRLFVRGDIRRVDERLPRFIPDDHWHRIVAAAGGLTPREVDARRLPLPYERTRAILAVLLECGLRAGELCRWTPAAW